MDISWFAPFDIFIDTLAFIYHNLSIKYAIETTNVLDKWFKKLKGHKDQAC